VNLVPNFAGRIFEAALRFPDRPAIEVVRASGLETTTYAALMNDASRFRSWLVSEGVRPGNTVAILADNDAAWIAAYLGILGLGAVAVPLDTAYKPAQIRAVLKDSGARVLFTTPKYAVAAREAAPSGAGTTIQLLDGSASGEFDATVAGRSEAAAVILYTSGTTADPKGVVLTHGNLEAERHAAFSIITVTEADAVLGVLPLFHALAQMANLLLPLSAGARVVFLETVNSTTLLDALTARRITIFACVPQFFYLIHQRVTSEMAKKGRPVRAILRGIIATNVWLRDHLKVNIGRAIFGRVHRALGPAMRLLITGGSKFDPAIGRDLYGLGFTILNAYGLTETSGGATIQRPGDRFTTSVGQPFPGVDARIGADGEILLRGPIVMREYYRRPDATADAIRDDWLHTGDLGHLDDRGRVHITGRLKEIIVLSSGKNLYPEEIETHYRQSAFIKELCVLGLTRPGEPAAERLHAVIVPDAQVLAARGIVNLRELVRFELETLSVALPAHKRILTYDITLEALPRTTTGKIKRHEVERAARERAAAAKADDSRELTADERQWLEGDQEPAGLKTGRSTLMDAINTRLAPRHARGDPEPRRRVDRTVRPDDNLELDLGLDSMERVELLTVLEQQAGTRVAPEVRAVIFTVRQLVDAVIAGAASADAATDAAPDSAWDAVLATPADDHILGNLRRPKRVTAVLLFAATKVIALVARVVWGFRTRGQAHLPADGPFIISPNHLTYVDGIFVTAALPFRHYRRLFLVGAAEYFETPLMSRVARATNIVPVDSDANLVTAMRAGATGLRLGKVLLLFPEGERSIDGTLRKFRKGSAILSAHVGVPIVPVAIEGLFEVWPRGRPLNWRALLPFGGTRIRVAFGPPLQATPDRYAEDTERLKGVIREVLRQSRGPDAGEVPGPAPR
jgi:long-chain acyl-CoA synthetase